MILPPNINTSARVYAMAEIACAPHAIRQRWAYRVAEDHIEGLVRSDIKLRDPLVYAFAVFSWFDRLPYPLRPRSRRRVLRIATECVRSERQRRAKIAARTSRGGGAHAR